MASRPVNSVSVDLGSVVPVTAAFDARTFPNLAFAVHQVAQEAQSRWASYAAGAALPDGRVITDRTGSYLRSIQMTMTGDFSASVFSNLPYAKDIEEGTRAWDMKSMLSSSLKVRLAKDGSRYLIIPFRYSSPGSIMGNSMPAVVHQWWTSGARETSHITGTYKRVSGTGALDIKTRKKLTVTGWKYHYGTKLTEADLHGMGLGQHEVKRFSGMLHFKNPKPKEAGGNSQFINFRVMSEKSKGWIRPAQAGRFPARSVAEQMRPIAEQAFKAAVEADIRAFIANLG